MIALLESSLICIAYKTHATHQQSLGVSAADPITEIVYFASTALQCLQAKKKKRSWEAGEFVWVEPPIDMPWPWEFRGGLTTRRNYCNLGGHSTAEVLRPFRPDYRSAGDLQLPRGCNL